MNSSGLACLALALALAAGCTSDPRYKQGLEWVQWNEEQKKKPGGSGVSPVHGRKRALMSRTRAERTRRIER